MDASALAKALQAYKIRRKQLEPERYEAMSLLRNELPDFYPRPAPPPPGTPPGEPPAEMLIAERNGKIIRALLAGEGVDDETMRGAFGFGYAELEAKLRENDPVKKPIPSGLVLMTFDDATLDHYETACPILERYGGRGVLFVTEMPGNEWAPSFEDKSRYMSWEQIKELSDRGHEIGNHSWRHNNGMFRESDEYITEQVSVIEERCEAYGIPRPTVFGYPGGGCTEHFAELLRARGYRWGRGDMLGVEPRLLGGAPYDPYVDSPMVVPHVDASSPEDVRELIERTKAGKVLLMVMHAVTDDMMKTMSFETLIDSIYESGGRCVTFRELEEYIDPDKAFEYTH